MGALIQQLVLGGLFGSGKKPNAGKELSDSYAWAQRQNERGLMNLDMPKPELKDEPMADIVDHNAAVSKYDSRKAEVDENNNPVNRFKRQIDNLMASGHPVLQERAMSLLGSYHDKATAQPKAGASLPSNVREYQWAVKNNGFKGTLSDWMQSKRPTTNINTSSNVIKSSEASKMVDNNGNPVKVPVGTTYDQAKSNGWSFGHRPDAAEAQTIASMEMSEGLLTELDTLISEGADISGVRGLVDGFRSEGTLGGVVADNILSGYGYDMSPKDIRAMSISVSLGNQLLQAFRGAAVGPKEQEMFAKQLPTAGQPKDVFKTNLELTRQNLAYIRKVKEAKRFGTKPPEPRVSNSLVPSNFERVEK